MPNTKAYASGNSWLAFEILFFLFAASKYSHRKSQNSQFQEKLMYEHTSWSHQITGAKENFDVVKKFLQTKDFSDDILEYVYKTARKRQDSFARIIESQVRPPTAYELNELRQFWVWIKQINLNITELHYIPTTFGTPARGFYATGRATPGGFRQRAL